MSINRRQFMLGSTGLIAAAASAGISNLVFADPAQANADGEILVTIFLRGGLDGLHLLAPYDDPVYRSARAALALPLTGGNAALQIDPKNATFKSSLGFHHKAAELRDLYNANKLAVIHACGLPYPTHSHVEAVEFMQRGTPGTKNTSTGWLTRHLQVMNIGGSVPNIAFGRYNPEVLLNQPDAAVLRRTDNYHTSIRFITSPRYRQTAAVNIAFQQLYQGSGLVEQSLQHIVKLIDKASYSTFPAPEADVTYNNSEFGYSLKTIAQFIKSNVGLRVAHIDFDSWDHHTSQEDSTFTGSFATITERLSKSLNAFYQDIAGYRDKVTVVVMSEFGRRIPRNLNNGTDHGWGTVMMVLGDKVNGGKVYGTWPGLDDPSSKNELKVTTDFRTVLSEILIRRLRNNKLGIVFPGFTNYAPLGITGNASEDMQPDYANPYAATPTTTPTTAPTTNPGTTPVPTPSTPPAGTPRKVYLPMVRNVKP